MVPGRGISSGEHKYGGNGRNSGNELCGRIHCHIDAGASHNHRTVKPRHQVNVGLGGVHLERAHPVLPPHGGAIQWPLIPLVIGEPSPGDTALDGLTVSMPVVIMFKAVP